MKLSYLVLPFTLALGACVETTTPNVCTRPIEEIRWSDPPCERGEGKNQSVREEPSIPNPPPKDPPKDPPKNPPKDDGNNGHGNGDDDGTCKGKGCADASNPGDKPVKVG